MTREFVCDSKDRLCIPSSYTRVQQKTGFARSISFSIQTRDFIRFELELLSEESRERWRAGLARHEACAQQ